MNNTFTYPDHLLLTEEDFLPSQEVLTKNMLTQEEYEQALRDEGCYDDGFYDEGSLPGAC